MLPSSHSLDVGTSASLPKFVLHCSPLRHELRKQSGTGKLMILVPLFGLKFLEEIAAHGAGRRSAADPIADVGSVWLSD